jgi:P27 family predicted phage terminase small subunit
MPARAKSANEHWLSGSNRPRAKEYERLAVPFGRPRCPAHLCEAARIEFHRVSKLLGARKAETPGDAGVLSLYANVHSRWCEAKKELHASGLMISEVVLDSSGVAHTKRKLSPLVRVVENAERQLLALSERLGLTPAAREKVKPTGEPQKKTPIPGSAWDLHPEYFTEDGTYIPGSVEAAQQEAQRKEN